MCVIVKDPRTRNGKMLQALLNSGCTKSIILKKFTSPEAQTRLSDKACCQDEIYEGHFTSNSMAMIVFRLVEFDKNKDLLKNISSK